MGIIIETSEKPCIELNSGRWNKAKSYQITIYSIKKVKICELDVFYSLVDNKINCPLSDIRTEKKMFSEDEFEVSVVTTYKDIDNDDVLICINANIYKRQHKCWNYRLDSYLNVNFFNDGSVVYECHKVSK